MKQQLLASSMAIALGSAMFLAGCSSSTAPVSSTSAQGYALRIVASPSPAVIGDTITVTFTIENTTSRTLTRTFADYWSQPQTRIVSGAGVFVPGNGFGDSVGISYGNTLVLEPQQVATGVSTLVAGAAGNAELSGCLPADVSTGDDAICVDAFLSVKAR